VKGFKDGMKGGEEEPRKPAGEITAASTGTTVEGEVRDKQKS
jgi:hypothetical protein